MLLLTHQFLRVRYISVTRFQPQIFENYLSINLKPEQFTRYLMSREVGFVRFERIAAPMHKAKGIFPLQIFNVRALFTMFLTFCRLV